MDFDFLPKMLRDNEIYKFVSVGIISGIFLLLIMVLFTKVFLIHYLLSVIISYELSLLLGFFLHEYWTFAKIPKVKKIHLRLLKFNMFYLIGLAINAGLLAFFVEITHLDYVVSEIIAISIVFIYNYVMSKKITFKE
jgi:putative flippase GtrA